jgi:xylulokinase
MSEPVILACDIGTSRCKVSLFDARGRQVAESEEGYAVRFGPGNTAEQNPTDWWRAFARTTEALSERGLISTHNGACVVVTGQMSACLPVDRAGEPLRPAMIWADQRASAESALIERSIGRDRLYRVTGNPPSETYPAPKILWLRKHEPEVFARTASFLQPKDYLVFRLTGRMVTDHSDASCTGLFDLERRVWSDAILAELTLRADLFPDVVPSTHVVGTVTRAAAQLSGLPEGLPVVIGGGDGPTAAVGAGAAAVGSGYINLGTSAWLSFCRETPLFDDRQRTFNYCHLVPGRYALTGAMQSAGASYDWCRRLLAGGDNATQPGSGDTPPAPGDLPERIPPGCDGLTFLPYLLGERTPYWDPQAAGAFVGLRPFHGRAHLLRAVLESIGLHLRLIHDVFLEQGVSADHLAVIGGGANNDLLPQMLSDMLQKPLTTRHLTTGATSFGAAICGAVGIGILKSFDDLGEWAPPARTLNPDLGREPVYRAAYRRFRFAYQALQPYFQLADSLPVDSNAATTAGSGSVDATASDQRR